MSIGAHMSELRGAIDRYLMELRLQNASPHTLRNYETDIQQFLEYFSHPGESPPAPAKIDALQLREWLGGLYTRGLSVLSIRRKLAAVRSLFRFMLREGLVESNVARLVRTPKAPKNLPEVPSAEHTNRLVDGVATANLDRPHPERDLLLFELLYGCGLRVSELCGLNLDDIDRSERWLRVRGKGKKERQVPFVAKAATALEKYLLVRQPRPGEHALLVNHAGRRLSDRGARGIVKFYAQMVAGDAALHPH